MSRPRYANQIVKQSVPDLLCIRPNPYPCSTPSYYTFDTVDLALVEQHHWYVGRGGRLCTHVGADRKTLYLARHLVGARKNQRVKHLDGDVTNLRRANLSVKTLARKKVRV